MPKKALHTAIKELVDQYGAEIVGDHRLKGLLADVLGESFNNMASMDQACRLQVGKKLLGLRHGRGGTESLDGTSFGIERIKQNFAEKSELDRVISDYVVDCIAYGLGLVGSVKKPSLNATTVGMTREITRLNAIIAKKSESEARSRKMRVAGVLGFLLAVAFLVASASFYDKAVSLNKSQEEAQRLELEQERIANTNELFKAVRKGDGFRAEQLLAAGANVFGKDSLGENLLFAAVRGDNLEWVHKLLGLGFSVNEKNFSGKRAFEVAKNSTARYLYNFANRDELFVYAVRNNKMDSAEYFLSLGANKDYVDVKNHYSAAHYAVHYNNVPALETLKSWGVNMNMATSRGTPVELAMNRNCRKAFRYLITEFPSLSTSILGDGETLLHHAIRNPHRKVFVPMLLNAGADIYQKNSAGNLPIHMAAQYGDSSLVKMFVERGCDPKVKNETGDEVIEIAERYDNKDVELYLSQYYFTRKIKGIYDSVQGFVSGILG